ncbi:KAP family P-loop NTPase fold protein [Vibrio furnissii]|uniref:KAP family P-loop NTPase fold protein n=1 Tax=Vibrio furnissii TaxID=29494 RepID=UPI0012AD5600|nr:P-loop NTPase fold protein [Vibrio furnissii]
MSNIHDVPRDQTFDKYNVIDRKLYSEHLTDFLNSKAKYGYVLNLNAEWGAGKTTFLQCWYNELKEKHPVVYFDAWKSDFTHDAMLALLEAFHSQLMNALTENKALLKKVMEGGTHFIKNTSWKLALGFIKRQGGMDADEPLFSDISEELNELGLDASDLTDSLKETFASMSEQKRKVEGVHDFKATLVELSKAYLEVHSDKKGPIYVLIDELDRCRPTYAIEVIESVKHFFNTENFVFVLATDTEQLQHSIRAVYGEGFDSANYLSRFFDRTATLSAPTLKQFTKIELTSIVGYAPKNDQFELISNIITWHGITSLREVKKIFNDIEVACSQRKSYRILPLIVLSILRHRYFQDYLALNARNVSPYNGPNENSNARIRPSTIVPSFKLTNNSSGKMSIERILFILSRSIKTDAQISDDTYTSSYINAEINTSLLNQATQTALEAFSHTYRTNLESDEHAERDDYFSLLDFAGYMNDVGS